MESSLTVAAIRMTVTGKLATIAGELAAITGELAAIAGEQKKQELCFVMSPACANFAPDYEKVIV